jgi:hypothetical protein
LAQHTGCPYAALTIKFLIDECLSGSLVAAAKVRGHLAHYLPHIGKAGWQDYNLVPSATAGPDCAIFAIMEPST